MVILLIQVLHRDNFVVKKYKQHWPLDQFFPEETTMFLRWVSFLPDLSLYNSRVDHTKTNSLYILHSRSFCPHGSVASFLHRTTCHGDPSGQDSELLEWFSHFAIAHVQVSLR